MTFLKTFFLPLLFCLGITLAWPASGQNYIDIDLGAAKKNPAVDNNQKAQPQPIKKVVKPPPRPISKVVKKPTPAQNTAAKPVLQKAVRLPVKPAVSKLKAKPLSNDELKLDGESAKLPTAPVRLTPPTLPTKPAKTAGELVDVPAAKVPNAKNQTEAINLDDEPRFKNRHAFTVDYSTWYETMKLKSKASTALTEATSHYFGVAFNYDYTVYREKYGFAVTLGGVTGNAQAGTKDSGDYYERRIVWTGFRGGGRLFFRANNRIDLGLGFLAQSKSTKWPEEDVFSVLPQANPQYFYYLDTRWRLNYRYEIVQAFGTHLRSYALAWLLGITYTLN